MTTSRYYNLGYVAYSNGKPVVPRKSSSGKSRGDLTQQHEVRISKTALKNVIKSELNQMGIYKKKDGKSMQTETTNLSKEDISNEKGRKWKVSASGILMMTSSLSKNAIQYNNAQQSGDRAVKERTLVSASINNSILALGAFGVYGILASQMLSFGYYMFGNILENSIQNKYDNQRLNYKFANYDLSKNSTYIYNDKTSKWIAQDTERVKTLLLGNKNQA